MRSLGVRLHKLRKLLNLKCGPGAAVLPPEVTRIHMDFALTLNKGHMGPRKFWRECLPRLKYHNPTVPMIVNRHNQNENAPLMTIYIRNPDATPPPHAPSQPASSHTNLSKAQPAAPHERVVHVDMRDKHSSQILEFFMAETRAVPLLPTAEEKAEMKELEQMRVQGIADRDRVNRAKAEKKREEDMIRRAREAGGISQEA